MTTKRLGKALLEVGYYAAGGTFFVLVFCGGVILFSKENAENPFLVVIAWTMIVTLVGGLILMGVGHVLHEASENEATPDLVSRLKKLEAEVTRLQAQVGPQSTSGPNATDSSVRRTGITAKSVT